MYFSAEQKKVNREIISGSEASNIKVFDRAERLTGHWIDKTIRKDFGIENGSAKTKKDSK